MQRTKAHQRYVHRLTGKPVPGATTIIKNLGWSTDALVAWARKTALAGEDPNAVRDQAADIGTLAHAMIEEYLGEKYEAIPETPLDRTEYPPAYVDTAEIAFQAFLDWEDSLKFFEPISSEERLCHYDLLYGGTVDMVAKINSAVVMVDFKTSNNVWPSHVIQCAAYREMLLSHGNHDPGMGATILHINKNNGKFTPHYYTAEQLEPAWEVFQHCLELHYLKNKVIV